MVLHPVSLRRCRLAALACWAGFALVTCAMGSGLAGNLDRSGMLAWHIGPAALEPLRDLTALGGVLVRLLVAATAVAALLFLRLRRKAALLAATILSGWIVNTAIKAVVGRPRPAIVPHLTEAGGSSFPSGHAFNSALVYIAIALVFAAMTQRRSARLTVIAGTVLLSLLIALSRVMLGVHWPSDVAAGWLGGAGWAFTATTLLHRPAGFSSHEDTKMPR